MKSKGSSQSQISPLFEKIYALVGQIPQGKVSAYGDIARALGNDGLARAVGMAMARNPHPKDQVP